MNVQTLRARFEAAAQRPLFVDDDGELSYAEWLELVANAPVMDVRAADVVALRIGPSASSIAWLWALLEQRAIVGLIGPGASLAERSAQLQANFQADDDRLLVRAESAQRHPLYRAISDANHAGLVLSTSGTSGVPKAAVHDAERFLAKFTLPGRDYRTLLFLPPDHVGGLDTLFYAMAQGSALVLPRSRNPADVARAIEVHRVQVLPTSPSFLNLLLLQDAATRYDLSSLQIVTFGAEPMPEVTLERARAALPHVRFVQKYGSTELGALRSESRDGTLWLRVREQQSIRIVDGRLQVKSSGALLGYLHGPASVDADGWLETGDLVERDGEWFRVRGRASELINVGGEKVFPSEVEQAVMQLSGVRDALAYAESNPLLGQVVALELVYAGEERGAELSALVKRHCRTRLAPHKVPARVRAVDALAMGAQKKLRTREP